MLLSELDLLQLLLGAVRMLAIERRRATFGDDDLSAALFTGIFFPSHRRQIEHLRVGIWPQKRG